MALSDYEKKMLAELEAQLTNEDPSFARNMKPAAPEVEAISRQLSVRNLVLGILGLVAGIAILIGGISAPKMWWLGLLGVIIMFASVWYSRACTRRKWRCLPAVAGRQRRPGRVAYRPLCGASRKSGKSAAAANTRNCGSAGSAGSSNSAPITVRGYRSSHRFSFSFLGTTAPPGRGAPGHPRCSTKRANRPAPSRFHRSCALHHELLTTDHPTTLHQPSTRFSVFWRAFLGITSATYPRRGKLVEESGVKWRQAPREGVR